MTTTTYFRKIIFAQNHKLGFCIIVKPEKSECKGEGEGKYIYTIMIDRQIDR